MDKPIMWLVHFVGWVRTSCVKSSIFCFRNVQELIFSWEILSELAGWPKIESQQQVDRIHLQMSEKWVSAPISLFSPFPASRQSPLISSDCTPILLQKSHLSLPSLEYWNVFFSSLEFNLQCMSVCVGVSVYLYTYTNLCMHFFKVCIRDFFSVGIAIKECRIKHGMTLSKPRLLKFCHGWFRSIGILLLEDPSLTSDLFKKIKGNCRSCSSQTSAL